jgi:hypothetical protein
MGIATIVLIGVIAWTVLSFLVAVILGEVMTEPNDPPSRARDRSGQTRSVKRAEIRPVSRRAGGGRTSGWERRGLA